MTFRGGSVRVFVSGVPAIRQPIAAFHALLLVLMAAMLGACSSSADRFVASATSYLEDGKKREAAIELKNALALEPDHLEANFQLGRLLAQVGNPVDAEVVLTKALKLGKPPADVLPLLGEVLLTLQKNREAIELLQVPPGPERSTMARIAVLRGRAFLGQGAYLDARTQFNLAMPDLPIEAEIGLARLALATNDANGAEKTLHALVQREPRNVEAWLAYGELMRVVGRHDAAVEAFDTAAKLAPESAAPLISAAVVHLTRDDIARAKPLLERSSALAPLDPMLEFANALLAFKENRIEDSQAALRRLFNAIPTYPPGLLLAGMLNYAIEQFDLAENAYTAYLARDANNAFARRNLAATLLAKNRPQRAIEVLAPLLGATNDVEARALSGRAYLALGDVSRAVEQFSAAVQLAPTNADLRVSLALALLAAGQRPRAYTELEAAIALKPPTARADHSLTMMLIADGKLAVAERVVANLAQRLPRSPSAPALRGTIDLARHDDAAARKHFEAALALDPAYLPAAEALADIERRAGDPHALRKRMEKIVAAQPENLAAQLLLARLEMEESGDGQANSIARVRAILAQHPRSLRALLMLGRAQLQSGKPEEAVLTARRAVEEHPWDSDAVSMLAESQTAAGDIQGAIVTLQRLSRLRPDRAEPHLRIAAAQRSVGDPKGALASLRTVLRMDAQNREALAMMGELYIEAQRFSEALDVARRLQQQRSGAAAGYSLEGDVFAAQGAVDRALASYQRAVALRPSGEILMRMHRAQTLVTRQFAPDGPILAWLARHPADADVRLYLADAYSAAGRFGDAKPHYEKLLARAPNDYRVLNNLAWALHNLGDPNALTHAKRAAELRPDDPRILDTLGYVLLAQGRSAESVQVLLKAAAAAPNEPLITLNLVEALTAIGDTGRARKELEAVLGKHKELRSTDQAKRLAERLNV